MKKLTSILSGFIPAALCLSFALLAINAKAQLVTNYWDTNGNTDGSGGPSPSGNWEDPSWTADPTGNSATGNWVEGNVPAFSAGSDAIGAYMISANSDHTVAGVQAPTGAVTINGPGILTNALGMQLFMGTNLTINAVLAGPGGFESDPTNNVYLYGYNTFSGGCNLNGGSTYINSSSSLGTGTVSPILGGASPVFSALYSAVSTITLTNPFSIATANAGIVFVPSTTTPLTLSGNMDAEQDFYCRNNGPGTSATPGLTTGILTLSGNISGPGGMILSCNGDNLSTIALYGANTYTGKTISDPNGGTRIYINFDTAQPIGSGIPNSLGEPPDAATGQIDLGHPYNATTGFADALRYTGSTDSTTDRIINNANGDPADGGMYLYADGSGAITYSGNITAVAASVARTLTIQGSSTALNTISGTISDGTGGGVINVNKEGPGTWRLLGNNTFTGSLTVQNTIGLGGTSTLIVGGSHVYTGATTINNGTSSILQLAADNPIPHGVGYGKFVINSGGTFELAGFNCIVNGGGGAGTIDNNTGTATLTIDNNILNTGPTFSGLIEDSGSGVLNFAANCGGTCQLTYSGGNTYHGYTAVSNALVQITAENQLGTVPGTLVVNNIILDSNLGWNGSANSGNYYLRRQGSSGSTDLSANRGIYLGNAAGYGGGIGVQSGGTLNVRGPISGPGGLWSGGGTPHAGTGLVVLYNTGNTYSGGTYVVGGTLRLGDNNVLPTGTPLTISDSQTVTFAMNSKSQTIGPLTGVSFAAINLNGALTIIENAPTTFAGVISQSGGSLILDASSTSTLTLTGANTFSGTTVINGGTLALSGSGAIGSSASITVGRGGTFDVSGVNTALTLGASQTLAAGGTSGSSATIATTSGFGLTLGASSPLNFTAYDGTTVPLTITGAGSLAIGTGNPVTVTTTTQLNPGSYKLVQIGAGNTTAITGMPGGSVTVNGSGMVAGGTASLQITGGELYLVVQNLAPVTQMSINSAGGGNLSINYSGGAGSQFVLLQTNKVAAPLMNWTRLKTNTLSPGSFTITPGSDPAEFYRVKSE